MDFPVPRIPPPPILTPFSLDSLGLEYSAISASGIGGIASASWAANNKAYFYPFRLFTWATAYQLLFTVGGTSSGNIDVGIYDSQLNRIVSAGSTGMSATVNTVQALNIADTVLPPGDYLLAVACSTTGGTWLRTPTLTDEVLLGSIPVYEQASAFPLPDPCVPVLCTDASQGIGAVGIQFVPTF